LKLDKDKKIENVMTLNPFDLEQVLEGLFVEFEKAHGLENIVVLVSSLSANNEQIRFIDDYRTIIRNNDWQFDQAHVQCVNRFVENWGAVHKKYIENSFMFYDFFKKDFAPRKRQLADIHDIALGSESSRGSVGKRSTRGLDCLLNSALESMICILDEAGVKDPEEIVDFIGGSVAPQYKSLESEIERDFSSYDEIVRCDLGLEVLSDFDARTRNLCAKMLRSYCRYSIDDFNRKLRQYRLLKDSLKTRRNLASQLEEYYEINNTIVEILKKSSKSCHKAFAAILDFSQALIYINDSLEPKYSFKGWAGLMHYMVFKEGAQGAGNVSIHERSAYMRGRCLIVSGEADV